MADRISTTQRSANMQSIKGKDTSPELRVRRLVHQMGYRYRLHRKNLPGKPDLVFGPRRKIIFVHGCFWHQHEKCRDGRIPGSNTSYWVPKLDRNVRRDQKVRTSLAEGGWQVMVVWECETTDLTELEGRLRRFLDENNGS